VAVGDAVATGEGIVVGKVSSVRTETATVELLTDSRSKFAAALLPEEGDPIPGVTEGGYGTGMVLRLIPEYARVQVGDLVFTSGLEAGVPRGLIIGRVESVRQEPHEPFQTATLSPLVPLDTLSIVAVVLAPR
jgi:rod shape-determining protein MreC